jgi:ribose transport system permease protein
MALQNGPGLRRLGQGLVRNTSFPALMILAALLAANMLLQPRFFTLRGLNTNLMMFTPLILAAMAQGIIVISGSIDMSLGSAISLFTIFTSYFMTDANVGWMLAAGFGVILVASGLVNGLAIGKFGLPAFITTYATSAIYMGLAKYILPQAGGYVPEPFYRLYRVGVAGIPFPLLILLAAFVLYWILSRTILFRFIYAIGSNEEGAYASGIKVARVRVLAHLVAAVFLSLACLCVLMTVASGDWRNGQEYTLNSVAAVVIGGIALTGGKGTVLGAVLGGLILGLLNNIIFYSQLSSYYQIFVKGMIVLTSLCMAAVPTLLRRRSSVLQG